MVLNIKYSTYKSGLTQVDLRANQSFAALNLTKPTDKIITIHDSTKKKKDNLKKIPATTASCQKLHFFDIAY